MSFIMSLMSLITGRQRSCGQVMFSLVSLFYGAPCDHYPWSILPHCTGPSLAPASWQAGGNIILEYFLVLLTMLLMSQIMSCEKTFEAVYCAKY